MTKLSSNAERGGEHPVQDKHRSGPEIDHGRRRFAWLTVGTASTATLMSRSAFGGGMNCSSKSPSAMESAARLGKEQNYTCNGMGPDYWNKNTRNWPAGMNARDSFNSVIWTIPTPAFNGTLRQVLRKRGDPQLPGTLEPYMNEMDPTIKTKFLRANKRLGPSLIACLLNCLTFEDHYALSFEGIKRDYIGSWDIPLVPATIEEAEQEVDNCRRAMNALRRYLERFYS